MKKRTIKADRDGSYEFEIHEGEEVEEVKVRLPPSEDARRVWAIAFWLNMVSCAASVVNGSYLIALIFLAAAVACWAARRW